MLTLPWHNPVLPGFIVFEGLDGAGTTTQAKLLWEYFNDGAPSLETPSLEGASPNGAVHTWEPTDFLTGKTIRTLLDGPEYVEPWTLALLFAADRHEHLYRPVTGIKAALDAGKTVISDRYLFSSLAYQGAFADFAAVESLNHQFPLPEHLIFIDTPRDTAMHRLSGREKRDSLENEGVQERAELLYREVVSDFRAGGRVQVHWLDGGLDVAALAGQIRNVFRR